MIILPRKRNKSDRVVELERARRGFIAPHQHQIRPIGHQYYADARDFPGRQRNPAPTNSGPGTCIPF